MSSAIETSDLVKTYPGHVRALDGVSLSVEEGTIFALLGPNGAGKSTAIKILTTLSRPDSGTVKVAGIDVLARPAQVRKVIGCVSQRSGVDREATGRENLRLQGRIYGMRGKELESCIDEMLGRFELNAAGDRIARNYSGGMERRLDIAMALVSNPRVLFLDEPTTGLDPEMRTEMWLEIERLASEKGLTILLTTHHMEEADRLASQLAIVDQGRIVASGSPDELKAQLKGDAIQVELEDSVTDGAAASALERIGGLSEVALDGRTLRARAEDGGRAVPVVLQALDAEEIKIASVTIARPSLDDVYLRHAGRTFDEAEAGGEEKS